jgi:hypothetical protein
MTPEEGTACERDKVALLVDACDSAAKHYEDFAAAFANLDTKASAVATIGGIVLAGVVAFLKDGSVPAAAAKHVLFLMLIVAAPLLALAAIGLSLLGAKVTEVSEPFDAPARMREAQDLSDLDCDEFSLQHIVNYYRAQLDHWHQAIDDIRAVVSTKANRVLWSQLTLMAALASLVALFVFLLFTRS